MDKTENKYWWNVLTVSGQGLMILETVEGMMQFKLNPWLKVIDKNQKIIYINLNNVVSIEQGAKYSGT